MEKPKICATCGRYPFNKNCNKEMKVCEEWIDREVQMYLKSKKGEVFEFKEIKEWN